MTRKRLRYSDLSNSPVDPATTPDEASSDPTLAESAAPSVQPSVRDDAPSAIAAQEPASSGQVPSNAEQVRYVESEAKVRGDKRADREDGNRSSTERGEAPITPPDRGAEAPRIDAEPQADVLPQVLRPRRNSTPVELARTLTAEHAAALADARATEMDVPDQLHSAPDEAAEVQRPLRELARRREGRAELLMFVLGGERFAVELVQVDEVIDLPVIHHVPEMPRAMLGVVTVRGSLTPVYSPVQALGIPLAVRDAVLIFRRGRNRVGILIDDVDDALSVDMSELRETAGGEDLDSVLLGVVRAGSSLIGIVDADALIRSCQSADTLEIA